MKGTTITNMVKSLPLWLFSQPGMLSDNFSRVFTDLESREINVVREFCWWSWKNDVYHLELRDCYFLLKYENTHSVHVITK